MKALQLQAADRVVLIEADIPPIDDDQLLIRTGAAVICTSDLHDIRCNPFGIALPMVIGHEGAGVVAKLGRNTRGFRVGDHVATHPVHPCGSCHDCRSGRGHMCASMRHFGLTMPGTFAEYYVVRADRARVVPATMPFELAALAEPVCVCLQALAQARVPAGGRLLILGDGPFGILMSLLARRRPLARLVVAGHHDFRLSHAAGTVVNTRNSRSTTELLQSKADHLGYDAAILAVGAARAVHDGLMLLRPKGRLVVFSPIMGDTPVDLFRVSCKELEIVGSCNDEDRFDDAIEALSDTSLGLEKLVTHRFAIEQYRQALATAGGGHEQALKVALTFGKEQGP